MVLPRGFGMPARKRPTPEDAITARRILHHIQHWSSVRTAAANAGTAEDLTALVRAMAPLKQVSTLESEFTAEVKRTTGI